MKVLFVFNHPAPYKVQLLNRISKSIDIMVIFERKKNADRNPSFYAGNNIEFPHIFLKGIPLGNENFLSTGIKNHIKNNHYDLIIMNGYSTLAEIIALNYLIKRKIPYILYVNGGVIRKDKPWKLKLKRKYIANASKYYSPNELSNEYLIHYGANRKDIRNYPYSTLQEKEIVSVPINIEEKITTLAKYNIPSDKPIFISAGQFIDRKNNLQLLEIFKQLPQYNLILVGEGPLEESYRLFIKENDMHNVFFIPFLPRQALFPLLRVANAFITLSKEDIYGHVINESLSQGVPVISSNKVVAASTLIQNGQNGYIIDLNNNEEIVAAIHNILTIDAFEYAISVAKNNTYEKSAEIHVMLWKGEI